MLKRRAWEVFNALVLVSHHAPALAATALAINNPAWRPVAAALAFNQIRTEGTSAGRELTRSIGDTVRVGNPSLPEPPYGQTLRPGDVVIWDNLKPHRAAGVAQAITGAGARLLPLPPYSPDYTPIESMYSKVKQWLRRVGARTEDALYGALGEALRRVTRQDILGWFQNVGLYATHE